MDVHSGGNLLVPPNSQSPVYDLDGNLTSDGLWSYTWDAENRLTSEASVSAVATAGKRKLVFSYDHQGRRVTKQVYVWATTDWNPAPVTDERFVYDGWNLLAELNATNNAPIRSYLWGNDLNGTMAKAGGIVGLVAMRDHGPGVYHFSAYDGNGNIMCLVNAQYEYSPFGETIRSTGPLAKANPFRWSTKFSDEESAMVYYGYRYYSPNIARWLDHDPAEESGGNNLYHFNFNDPLGRVDSLGNGSSSVYDLGQGWTARIDPFNIGGSASFEMHVFDALGEEAGILTASGWIAKHGGGVPPAGVIPDDVYRVIKGVAVNYGRKTGEIAAKGSANIKNWLWNGTMGAIEKGGKVAGVIVAAVAINAALESGLEAAESARSYARNLSAGETAYADLDAIDIAIHVQDITGNYFMTDEALDILLK